MEEEKVALDKRQKRKLKQGVKNYGAYLQGGTASERRATLLRAMNDPICIEGAPDKSLDDIFRTILGECLEDAPSSDQRVDNIDVRRALGKKQGIAILGFDKLDDKEQTAVARWTKGLAERRGYDGQLGFTGSANAAVVRAEPDLSMRINNIDLDE